MGRLKASGPGWLSRRLREARERVKQRSCFELFQTEIGELQAIVKIAQEAFGRERAVVWADATQTGLIKVGYFTQPKGQVRENERGRDIVAQGYTVAEIGEQIRLWKASRS